MVKYNKHLIQTLSFHSHIDELPLFYKLKEILGVGHISLEKNSVKFYISDYNELKYIIIPIFEEFHLNSSKYLNYEDFKLVFQMRENKEHLLAENKEKILKIKAPDGAERLYYFQFSEVRVHSREGVCPRVDSY